MAFYSTWDWNRNAWKVYRTSDPVSVGDDPKPPKPSNLHVLGADPDTQMKPLPFGAAFVGYDHIARGEIRAEGGLSLGDATSDTGLLHSMLILGVGIFVASIAWELIDKGVGGAVLTWSSDKRSKTKKNRRRR